VDVPGRIETGIAQRVSQHLAFGALVVHDQDARPHEATAGKKTEKVLP
jgi:hypothetical protein